MFEFMGKSFARIKPIERVWIKFVEKPSDDIQHLFRRSPPPRLSVGLFAEAQC